MNGVEILTSFEVVTSRAFDWKAFWIAASVIFGIFLVAGFFAVVSEHFDWSYLVGAVAIGLFMSGAVGLTIGSVCSHPTEYETRYKVTISDEVSMNEFMEKYEIINQDGKIYTIRERN